MRVLLVALSLLACNQAAPKVTATKIMTSTLKGVGALTTRLEIHSVGNDATATAWMSWNGEYEATITALVRLYRWDTVTPNPLSTNEKDLDLKAGQDKTVATPPVSESRRLCASVALVLEGYDADANTVTRTDYSSTCERS